MVPQNILWRPRYHKVKTNVKQKIKLIFSLLPGSGQKGLISSLKLATKNRSSHRRCSVRKGVLRNFALFTGKYQCQRLFFNKVAGLRPVTLAKKRLWHRCFSANFATFLRTPFLQNTSGRLLLQNYKQYKLCWSFKCWYQIGTFWTLDFEQS